MSEPRGHEPDTQWAPVEPREDLLASFWVLAAKKAKLNPLEVIVGSDDTAALCPPAFCFGASAEEAQELCELVVTKRKSATSGWKDSYDAEGVPLPQVGEMAIVCDGSGAPRALIRESDVRCIPFEQIDSSVAEAEGEGDLAQWKEAHRRFFTAECAQRGDAFDPHGIVVVEFFDVLYAH